jgi:hypothetical protein
LVVAVHAVRHLTSDAIVKIAGRGSLHDALVADARATGRAERVELLGFVDDERVGQGIAHPLGDGDGVVLSDQVFAHDYEFVTTEPGHGIGRP